MNLFFWVIKDGASLWSSNFKLPINYLDEMKNNLYVKQHETNGLCR